MTETAAEITKLLSRLSGGEQAAAEQLMPLLYADLHKKAQAIMQREQHGVTLQPTALLNEAWMRLQPREGQYADRTHFLRLAGRIMRNVLVDHARRRRRTSKESIDDDLAIAIGGETDGRAAVLDLQAALERLAARDPELEQIVELRFFGGLTVQETAAVLEKSPSAVHRAWELARAFLLRELRSRED